MIRVLHVISDTNIGGAGTLLLTLLEYRDKSELNVAVALPEGSLLTPRIKKLGVPVHELSALRDKSFDTKAIAELTRLIKREKPDIVHTHGAFAARIAARRAKVPSIYTKHTADDPSPRLTHGLGRALFRFLTKRYTSHIIAVSSVCRDGLLKCGVPPEMVTVVWNGSPPVRRIAPDERNSLRKKYGADENTFVVGVLARIERYKGQDVVIEAAKILMDTGRNVLTLIAGTGSYEADAKHLTETLGVTDTVKFVGFTDAAEFLGALDVQVNASRYEAACLSLIEGMSVGVPAIASDIGGNPHLIRGGENGLLFKSENPQSLADAIVRLMDDRALLTHMGEVAERVYNAEFTCARCVREVGDIYRKVKGAYK